MPPVRQVVLLVVDGLRPDALQRAPTLAIDRLVARGAHTWQAQTVVPSLTLPRFVSMFYAVPPSRHGVITNVSRPPKPRIPRLIEVVHRAGLGTAAFYSWEELRDLAYYRLQGGPRRDADREIAAATAQYLAECRPAFTFVCLEGTDKAGHCHGWMSAPYLQAGSQADQAVGLVLEGLHAAGYLADTACLLLANHGGQDHDHGTGVAQNLTIPWIVSGPGIRPGHAIAGEAHTTDTAPTLMHLLGLPQPAQWSGRVVVEAQVL
jgi:predicted AlkP superfamily pyrophosphatase or phosphodiesterase